MNSGYTYMNIDIREILLREKNRAIMALEHARATNEPSGTMVQLNLYAAKAEIEYLLFLAQEQKDIAINVYSAKSCLEQAEYWHIVRQPT